MLDFYGKTGAGEGIRTLDPNLGNLILALFQSFFFFPKLLLLLSLLTNRLSRCILLLSPVFPILETIWRQNAAEKFCLQQE